MYPQQRPSRAKVLAITGLGFLFVVIVIIGFTSLASQPKPVTIGDENDPSSSSSNKTSPDVAVDKSKPTSNANNPNKVPVTSLSANGVSSGQLNALQQGLYKFSQAKKKDITTVAIDKTTIKHIVPDINAGQYNHIYSFTVFFGDNDTYDAKFVIGGLNIGRLYMYSHGTTNLLFDSQTIDSTKP